MSESKANFIEFQGVLIERSQPSADGLVQLLFSTPRGLHTMTAYNPLLLPSLQLGATYHIKGHEKAGHGTRYVRIMSARALLETKPLFFRYGRKLLSRAAPFAALCVLAIGALTPSIGLAGYDVSVFTTGTTNTTTAPLSQAEVNFGMNAGDRFEAAAGELSSSNATTTDFQPSQGLQVRDASMRPTLDDASLSKS